MRLVVPELQRRGVFRDRYTGDDAARHPRAGPPRGGRACLRRTGPLHGVRVVDAATLAAGPLVATAMGEFGADVIKVEQPGVGDPLRTWGDRKDDIGLVWKSDEPQQALRHPGPPPDRGPGAVPRAARRERRADRRTTGPSAMVRWGIDYESVHERHPQLVMLHVSGYGRGGPKSDSPGFGTLAEAMSGFAHLTGQPDGPPTLPPFMLADGVAALAATYAVMMALYHRDVHGGGGQLVDVNLIEPLARLIESSTLAYDQLGKITGRVGNRFDASAPRNAYRTCRRQMAGHLQCVPEHRRPGLPGHRPSRPGREPRLRRPRPPSAAGRRGRRPGGRLGRPPAPWPRPWPSSRPPRWPPHPSTTPSSCWPTSTCVARGTFVAIDDPDLGAMTVQAPVAVLTETPGPDRPPRPAAGRRQRRRLR